MYRRVVRRSTEESPEHDRWANNPRIFVARVDEAIWKSRESRRRFAEGVGDYVECILDTKGHLNKMIMLPASRQYAICQPTLLRQL